MQLAESPIKHIGPLLLRCMQHVVRALRAQLAVKQLEGFNIHNSFGSLTRFAEVKWFKTLMDRNKDPDDAFHFQVDVFTAFVIIGRDVHAGR